MYDLSNLCVACVFLTTLINSVYARKLLLMLILCFIIIVACEEWYINKINNNLLTGESIHLLHDEASSWMLSTSSPTSLSTTSFCQFCSCIIFNLPPLLFNHVRFLETYWTSPCSFLGKAFLKWFAIASFLKLSKSDWPKVSQVAFCPRQD